MRAWAWAVAVLAWAGSGCLAFHEGALPGAPADALWKEVGGARVRYTDEGDGPAVVMLHGFGSSLGIWKQIAPELAKKHRVVTLDLKGFGWTDRAEGDYSPKAQAALVWELLDSLGVKDVAVVAHSWGSSVALEVALGKPDRVRRLALYDAWVYEEQLPSFFYWARTPGVGEALVAMFYRERTEDKLARAFYSPAYVTEAVVDDVDGLLARPGALAAILEAIRGQRFEEVQGRYREVDKPVLLLWGREDQISTMAVGERLSRDLPQARMIVYPRCGHFPMVEAREVSTQDVAAFLAEEAP